jgi:hypothetical protein
VTFVWRRTFPDTHHDFVAEETGQHVGRIKRIDGGPQEGTWTWSCTSCQRGHEADGVRPLNGMTASRDEAIEALAAAWSQAKAWRARTGLSLAQLKRSKQTLKIESLASNASVPIFGTFLEQSQIQTVCRDQFLHPARGIEC